MASFKKYADKLLLLEGGFVDHPADYGRATNRGITLATWQAYGRDINKDGKNNVEDLKLISEADALQVYKTYFWDTVKGDHIQNQALAEIVFDMFVNAPSIAVKMLQAILNRHFGKNLATDGVFGPSTLAATNSVDAGKLHDLYKEVRVIYYNYRANNLESSGYWPTFFQAQGIRAIESQKVFLKGWLNRVASFSNQFKKKVQLYS
jgi:lysozyme family protein